MIMQKPGYINDEDGRMDLIILIRHLCWYSYMLGAGKKVSLDMDVDQYSSQRNGVVFLDGKMNATPQDNHDHWLKYKRMLGWKFGDELDPKKKEHPCMIPFDDLPPFEANKDELAILSYDIANQIWENSLKHLPSVLVMKVPVNRDD